MTKQFYRTSTNEDMFDSTDSDENSELQHNQENCESIISFLDDNTLSQKNEEYFN